MKSKKPHMAKKSHKEHGHKREDGHEGHRRGHPKTKSMSKKGCK